ncbi:MAG: hypothetical protein LBJ64_03215 [Deltaproteobacteria bacterium]|jgi:hypothetical protein|nr:hypothetical protein [Deltaproteobacteria bacterium]
MKTINLIDFIRCCRFEDLPKSAQNKKGGRGADLRRPGRPEAKARKNDDAKFDQEKGAYSGVGNPYGQSAGNILKKS